MKKTLTVLIFVVITSSQLFAAQLKTIVLDIVDGDTIVIQTKEGRSKIVHLGGFEAPEPGQPFFFEAKELTREIINEKPVTISYINLKKNIVKLVPANYKNIALATISKGLGWVTSPYGRVEKDMELKARREKIGIWSKPNPVSPWNYRDKSGKKKNTRVVIGKAYVPISIYGDKASDIKRDPDGTAIGHGGAFSGKSKLQATPPIQQPKMNTKQPEIPQTTPPNKGPLVIKRLYQSSSDYYRVVVQVTRRLKAKCVLFDSNKNPLVVDEQYVDPPMDEILMRTQGIAHRVKSVECYHK